MFPRARVLFALAAATSWALIGATAASASPGAGQAPASHYNHIFVIVEENHSYTDVIGNPATPNLNALARTYGIATKYFAVAHPSEPNYVAILGGSPFSVQNDNPYYLNRVAAPSLISEFDHAHVSWKAYLQSLPHPGFQGICYPANCNGSPDKDPLYVSKHDGIQNFTTSLNAADWSRQVPIDQLSQDLRKGNVPSFSWVIPDECRDQHGDPPYCLDSGNTGGGDPQDQHLLTVGDQYLGQLVAQITHARFWAKGNNAIDIVYDEGDNNVGGGGRVANIVVTSHGPRHLKDAAHYSHYSLLRTIQQNFGVACLQHSCGAATNPMTPLFAVTGSAASAFTPLPEPAIATPTPMPSEPVKFTADTSSSGGWTVQRVAKLGTNDNSFGGVAAVSPGDVWAAGNFLPDTSASNQDATLAMATHFNGTKWTQTPVPDAGPNYNTLFGVAATHGRAWAVGVALDKRFEAHSLIEAWNGSAWHIAKSPRLKTQRDILFSATAVSPTNVWAVGQQQLRNGVFRTLVEHWNGSSWSVVRSPNPGSSGNSLFGVAQDGPDNVWAVGQRSGQHSDSPLVERWNGKHWMAVTVPDAGLSNGLLQAVAVRGSEVWAVGQSDDAAHQGHPLVEHRSHGAWTAQLLSNVGAVWSDIGGVAIGHDAVWLVGSTYDKKSDTEHTVVAKHTPSGWKQVPAPNPGTGDRILGGISAAGNTVWAAGLFETDAGRNPLVELHMSK
jgi:hypothetical protein